MRARARGAVWGGKGLHLIWDLVSTMSLEISSDCVSTAVSRCTRCFQNCASATLYML